MTISFVNVSSSTSLTVPLPAGLQDNDKMLAHIVADNSGGNAASAPAGWTKIPTEKISTGSTSFQVVAFEKTANSESGDVTFTMAGASNFLSQISAFRDDGSGGSWDETTDRIMIDNGVTDTATSSAVSVLDEDMLYVAYGDDGPRTVVTPPSGMTEILVRSFGTRSDFSYFEAITSTDATAQRTLVVNIADDMTSIAYVLRFIASAGGTILPQMMQHFN